jgi:CspA family cold shock protein
LALCAPFSFFPCRRGTGHPGRRLARPTKKDFNLAQIGTVKFFNMDKGFGFIAPDNGGADAFVHISAVERAGFATLQQNQRVSYELENDKRGRASAVSLEAAE